MFGCNPPKPPPPIDYAAAATAQGAANLKSGLQTTSLSNPNIYTPSGNQTVTYDTTTNPDMPQATVTQTLTPEGQATFEQQQKVEHSLADLAGTGVTTAQNVLNKPFEYAGPDIQTSLAAPGALNYGPTAGQYGLAGGGPAAGQYGQAKGIDAGLYGSAKQNLDLSNVAAMPVNAGMTGQAAIMSRLQPQIAQQGAATAQQLANQGITPGSEAYNNAMRTQQNQFNDLYTQAALQGINLDMSANNQGYGQALSSAGLYNAGLGQNFGQGVTAQEMQNAAIGQNFGEAQSAQQAQNAAIAQNYGQGATSAGLYNQAQHQQYNQGLQAAQFGNNAAQQSLAQQLQLRNQPLNEINALMSGSQIQMPSFQGYQGANVAAAPVFQGAQAGAQQAQDTYGQQMAAYNAKMGALGSAVGGIAGMIQPIKLSDRRLKSNIIKIGEHPLGIGIYEYDIFGQRDVGVMAQEVERVKPEAVVYRPDGYLMVNYGAL